MLWVLGSLCQLYRIPFDAKLILQRYAPPYSLATLGEAAEALGLQVGEWQRVSEFAQVSLPSVALVKAPLPGQAANDADDVPAPATARADLEERRHALPVFPSRLGERRDGLGDRLQRAVRRHGVARGTGAAGGQRARRGRGQAGGAGARLRLRLVRAGIAQAPQSVARCPARFAHHPVDGARHAAVHAGDHRQGDRASDPQHADGGGLRARRCSCCSRPR